jgi:hypothetical protein
MGKDARGSLPRAVPAAPAAPVDGARPAAGPTPFCPSRNVVIICSAFNDDDKYASVCVQMPGQPHLAPHLRDDAITCRVFQRHW